VPQPRTAKQFSSASRGSCAFTSAARRNTVLAFIQNRAGANIVVREIAAQTLLFGDFGLTWDVEVTSARLDAEGLHAQVVSQLSGQFTPLAGSQVATVVGTFDPDSHTWEYEGGEASLVKRW
jgi:hypothetical protein